METAWLIGTPEAWLCVLPPIIAIALALITKQVYISLFIGIFSGAMIATQFDILGGTSQIFEIMAKKVGDGWNFNILVFLVILGCIVALIQKAGGSAAYGNWAAKRIKTKTGAMLSTSLLGGLIFIDDYFNCLTVGSVMRPVTDKRGISRAKLAYIIDATAAPICIIAPISSWAAAVSSSLPEGSTINGFNLFIQAIPYNFYAILTILMLVALAVWKFDFGPMKKHEENAAKGDLFTTPDRPYGEDEDVVNPKGRVFDLIIPIAVLIIFSVTAMVYTGGFFSGVPFGDAFADCDASVGLVFGALATLIVMLCLYLPRKVIKFPEFCNGIVDGFKAMVPAILILTFAWTLSGFTNDVLGAGEYIAGLIDASAMTLVFLPAIMFLIALGLAFATGTSWGTFAILVPIVVGVFGTMGEPMVMCVAAVLAGAVCGDHCSPISDTTIMASAGAKSNHINHVNTQLPYALTVAGVCVVSYIIAGLVQNIWISLPISIVLLAGALFVAYKISNRKKAPEQEPEQ